MQHKHESWGVSSKREDTPETAEGVIIKTDNLPVKDGVAGKDWSFQIQNQV